MKLCLAFHAVLLLAACAAPRDDAALIHEALTSAVVAFESGDAEAFDEVLAPDFIAGELDRQSALLLARRYRLMHRQIGITLNDVTIEVFNDFAPPRATVRFQALLTGGENVLPERAGWYRFATGWRRDGDEWRIIRAAWERQW